MIYTKDHQTDNPKLHHRSEDGKVHVWDVEKREWVLKEENKMSNDYQGPPCNCEEQNQLHQEWVCPGHGSSNRKLFHLYNGYQYYEPDPPIKEDALRRH